MGESDLPDCGPSTSLSVYLASSAITPAGSIHKSRGDNVVRVWVQLEMMCVVYVSECYKGYIVVMGVILRRLGVSMI